MPVIYDEDKPVDHGNAADEEQRRLANLGSHSHPSEADDSSYVKNGLNDLENHANDGNETASSESEKSLFNPGGDSGNDEGLYKDKDKKGSRFGRMGARFKGLSKGRKIALASAASVGTVGVIAAVIGLFGFMNVFRLDHFLSNVERKAFIRYQVDMDGRSSKWLNAYLVLRMGEVENPELAPEDRENLIFRAERVDNNKPLTDWYKTMRTSKFEADLYEKQGIKFASVAYVENGMTKFRPAIITVGNDRLTFNPTAAEISAIEDGRINDFNGRLGQFVDVERLDGDRAGRRAIKQAVNSNTQWYQVMKRLYLRKSIQNMTGVRSWRFFEKSRNAASEKTISVRNKIITSSLPEDTKSGKVARCIFGIADCSRQNTDSNNPANRAGSAAPSLDCQNNPACTTTVQDDGTAEEGDTIGNDGTAESIAGGGEGADYTTKAILNNLLAKLNVATSVVSIVDTLNKINDNVKNGSLSKLVYMGRATQYIGLFTTMGIARDQMRSGEVSSQEVGEMMSVVDGAGRSEGWYTAIDNGGRSNGKASAASMKEAQSKEEYCDSDHQAAIIDPANREVAESEISYSCDSEKIGSADAAKTVERVWNKYIGGPLGPVFAAYTAGGVLSGIVGALQGVADATIGAAINGALGALGLSDNIEDLMAWALLRVSSMFGATPTIDPNSPGGVYANQTIMGAAASAEFASRFQGGARTNSQTAMRAEKAVAAYEGERRQSENLLTKYASLNNSQSLFSAALFNASDVQSRNVLGSMMSSIASLPSALLSSPASAATETGYDAAKFAGVNTYDFPKECTDSNPLTVTPEESTNADNLGLISASELSWDLMKNSDAFYGKLYELNPDKGDLIDTVYDCAALDDTIRGSLGAAYGADPGPNALIDGASTDGEVSQGEGSLELTVASFNILHIGDQREAVWKKRLHVSTDLLINQHAVDVAGLQEMRPDQIKAFNTPEFGGGVYNMWPSAVERPAYTPNPIIWNKSKFKKIGEDNIPFKYFGGMTMQAPVVKLQQITTDGSEGRVFYVINTHDPAQGSTYEESRYNNVVDYGKYLKRLTAEGHPIFFVGDFNSGYSVQSTGLTTKDNDPKKLAYCVMTSTKEEGNYVNTTLWDAFDAEAGNSGQCPSVGKPGTPGVVDHIFLSRDVQVRKYIKTADGPEKSGSDHHAIIAKAYIPGLEAAGDSLKIGSYNTLTGNFSGTDRPGFDALDEKRYEQIAKLIKSRGMNIVGTQETRKDERAALLRYLDGYKATELGDDVSDIVFYQTSLFTQTGFGSFTIPKAIGGNKAIWVKLKAKSGKSLYIINMHAMVGDKPAAAAQRTEDARIALQKMAEINGSGEDPVFIMGDMNSNYSSPGRREVFDVFKNSGKLRLAFEETNNRKGTNCDTHQSRDGRQDCRPSGIGSHIDHIWYTKDSGVKVNSWENIADNVTIQLSDHNPQLVDVTIPGITADSAGGSVEGWTWPFTKDGWNGPFGYNVWGNEYCGSSCGRHSGIDMSGTAGKSTLAAHDGEVVKISSSASCKTSVLIKATGTPYWIGYQHLGSANVKVGDSVTAGKTTIGPVYSGGGTSCVTGPHLHFSIEKSAKISAYSDGAGVCNVNTVACAKQMTTVPPLCLLDKDGRNYGGSVPGNQIKGSDYCNQLVGGP